MKFLTLSSVCFDFKLIPEMIFRKSGCLIVTSNLVKLKNISSWLKNIAKTTENDFRFHFHFKWLLALENRRKREREREQEQEQEDRRCCTSSTIAREIQREKEERRSQQFDDRTSPTPTPFDLAFAARSRLCLHWSNPFASLSSFFSQFDQIWWIFLLGFVSFVSECGIDSFSTCL